MKKSITRLSVYFAVLGAVFLITVITVSASEVKTPVWVSAGTDERYPQVRYLSAVGMGSSRESAISDAKKQLAGIFSSKVEATLQSSSQSETTETISGQMTGSDQTNTQSSTKVTVDVVLKGVEVRET